MKFLQTIKQLKASSCLILFCCVQISFAENHIITQTIVTENDEIISSPILNFDSSIAIQEAIDNGVRINLIIKAQLFTPNNWWFDHVIENQKQLIEIYYFQLGRLYVAKNLSTNEQISVNEYENIWNKFQEIISFKFNKGKTKAPWLRMRVMLDTRALPTTMQLPVLFDNNWDINTKWHSQKINFENNTNE